MLTLDRQILGDECGHCGAAFTVVRGSAYEDGNPFGLYLIALHSCTPQPQGLAAIAIREPLDDLGAIAVALRIWTTTDELQMTVTNWDESPWATEDYLGRMLARDEALASPHIKTVFHVADHIVRDIPEVRMYFDA